MKPIKDIDLHRPTLGSRLKALRKRKGLTQTELGEMLGLPQQRIYRFEADKEKPRVPVLAKLSQILDASFEYLIVDGLPDVAEKGLYVQIAHVMEKMIALKCETSVKVPKMVQMVLFFATVCDVNMPKLSKLLFFSDFLAFKEYKGAISNFPYIRTVFGPSPVGYKCFMHVLDILDVIDVVVGEFDYEHEVILDEQIEPELPLDKNMFEKHELGILRRVSSILGDKTSRELSEILLDEMFFSMTEHNEIIPYDVVNRLQIDNLNLVAEFKMTTEN